MTTGAMSARPPSSTLSKKKRRRMKQMEGLLVVSRPELDEHHKARGLKPKKVHVMLQPQQLQLAYSAHDDQEMTEILGRIDLHDAKLEQTPDGFLIHDDAHGKKLKLHDKDKATIDAWFYAVYATITEFARTPVEISERDTSAWHFSCVVSASHRDEVTDVNEYELSCQLVIPARSLDEPSIRWKAWRTASEIQAFDDELHRIPLAASLLRDVSFPRERKRDSLFGGLRGKSVHQLREQQLAVYVERVFRLQQLSADETASKAIRHFLHFDIFFELSCEESGQVNNNALEREEINFPQQFHPNEYADTAEPASYHYDPASQLFPTIDEQQQTVSEDPQPTQLLTETSAPVSGMASFLFDESFEEIAEVEPETDPAAAKKLHKQVLRTVREIYSGDEDRVRDFQDQTKDFGRDKTDVKEYCAFLHGALGAKQCCVVIPMMARLMPDEDKRHALLEARTQIIRKTMRRNRRRSKQFSESIVLQQQRHAAVEHIESFSHAPPRTRPKSDSLSVLMSQNSLSGGGNQFGASSHQQRSSMLESRSSSMGSHVAEESGGRKSLPDARRKVDSRSSFSLFGEFMHGEAIEEENPAASDSDENTQSDDHRHHVHHHQQQEEEEASTVDVKSLPPVFRRVQSNPWLQQPRSVPSGGQPGYGQRANVNPRERPTSVGSSGYAGYVVEEEAESHDGHYGHHGQNHHQPAADDSEENPVLARLRKQGAVSFMLR